MDPVAEWDDEVDVDGAPLSEGPAEGGGLGAAALLEDEDANAALDVGDLPSGDDLLDDDEEYDDDGGGSWGRGHGGIDRSRREQYDEYDYDVDDYDEGGGGGGGGGYYEDGEAAFLDDEQNGGAADNNQDDGMFPPIQEIIAKHTRDGVVSGYMSTRQMAGELESGATIRHVEGVRNDFNDRVRDLEVVRQQLKLERSRLQDLRASHAAVKQELESLRERVPHALSRHTQETVLLKRLSTESARLSAQEATVRTTQRNLLVMDRARDLLQQELHRFDLLEQDVSKGQVRRDYEREALASWKADNRDRGRRRVAKKLATARAAEATKAIELARERQKRAAAAKIAKKVGRERLIQHLTDVGDVQRELNVHIAQHHEKRAKAVLSLKANTNAAHASIAASNERRRKHTERVNAARAKEKTELLAVGRNPHGVFSARDEAARLARRKQRLAKRVRQQERAILDQLYHESQIDAREDEEAWKRRGEKEAYKRIMGRSVLENEAFKVVLREDGGPQVGQIAGGAKASRTARKRREVEAKRKRIEAREQEELEKQAALQQQAQEQETARLAGTAAAAAAAANATQEASMSMFALAEGAQPLPGDEHKALPIAWNETRLKLAQKKVAGALDRQKKRLSEGVPKLVCGKTYNTSKFLSEPKEIIFKDFEVGQVYKKRINITNVSFTFNTFKVLKLADEFVDFFEVKFTPAGRLSAGQTAPLSITFRPKLNQEIDTVLPLLAETGPFEIPLRCFTKKAVVSVLHPAAGVPGAAGRPAYIPRALPGDPLQVVFGGVVRAEEGKHVLVIRNDGALEVPFRVSVVGDVTSPEFQDAPSGTDGATSLPMLKFASSGRAMPFSTQRFPVVFAPSLAGDFGARLKFEFGPKIPPDETIFQKQRRERWLHWGSPSSFEVDFTGQGLLVPIYVEQEVLDFQCCILGKLYRCVCRIHNRGLSALKVHLQVPRALRGFVEFSPKLGYVQAGSYLDVQVKVLPRGGLRERVLRISTAAALKEATKNAAAAAASAGVSLVDAPAATAAAASTDPIVTQVDEDKQEEQSADVPAEVEADAALASQGDEAINAQQDVTAGEPSIAVQEAATLLSKLLNPRMTPWTDEDDNTVINVPVRIVVPDQVLPVSFTLRAKLASAALKFSIPEIDFGRCFITAAVAVPLVITNDSPLIQKMSFVNLPSSLDVQPGSGVLAILPNRSRTVNVIFSPESATVHHLNLTIRTKHGDEYSLPCNGIGVKAPVSFSSASLKLGAVPDGDVGFGSTVVTNVSSVGQLVEVVVPPPSLEQTLPGRSKDAFLSVSPSISQVEPGESVRLEFTFAPRVLESGKFEELAPARDQAAEEAKDEEQEEEKAESSARSTSRGAGSKSSNRRGRGRGRGDKKSQLSEEEQRSLEVAEQEAKQQAAAKEAERIAGLLQERIEQQYVTEQQEKTARISKEREHPSNDLIPMSRVEFSDLMSGDPNEPWSRHGRHRVPVFVRAVSASDAHMALENGGELDGDLPPPSRFSVLYIEVQTTTVLPVLRATPKAIDFGQVAAGKTNALSFQVQNTSVDQPATLRMKSLGFSSPFRVLNALRTLPPGASQIVVVEFRPTQEKRLAQDLVVECGHSHVTVPLRGHCISPNIAVSPAGDILDMGDVVSGETVSRTITITNNGEFPFGYSIQSKGPEFDGERNLRGMSEFYFVPGEGTVAPGEGQEVEVFFSPDHPSLNYVTTVSIGEHQLQLRGRSWARQLFVYDDAFSPTPGRLSAVQNPVSFLEDSPVGAAAAALSGTGFASAVHLVGDDMFAGLGVKEFVSGEAGGDHQAGAGYESIAEASSGAARRRGGKSRQRGQGGKSSGGPSATLGSGSAPAAQATGLGVDKGVVLEFSANPTTQEASDDGEEKDDTSNDANVYRRFLKVGCCLPNQDEADERSNSKSSCSIDLTLAAPHDRSASIWNISPASVNLTKGQTQQVEISFDLNQFLAQRASGADSSAVLDLVGQWVECPIEVWLREPGNTANQTIMCKVFVE